MYLNIILIAFSLSMDAFSVSVSGGLMCKKLTLKETLLPPFIFAFFQAIMPLIGFYIIYFLEDYIQSFDFYIASASLFLIGAKMIYEGFVINGDTNNTFNFFSFSNLLFLGVATSIDALFAGFTLSIYKAPLLHSIGIIGLITFIVCIIGIRAGCYLGKKIEKGSEFIGGAVLIILSIKTLLEGLNLF